jgi:hypothetical protein
MALQSTHSIICRRVEKLESVRRKRDAVPFLDIPQSNAGDNKPWLKAVFAFPNFLPATPAG